VASARVDLMFPARAARAAARDVDRVDKSVEKLGRTTERTGKRSRAADASARRLHKGMKGIATAATVGVVGLGAMTAGAGAFAVSGVKAAVDFQASVSQLGAITNAGAKEIDQLRASALDAGAATQYSAAQAVQAQTELAKGGVSTASILKGGLRAALSLAAAGQLELAEAAAFTANAMNLFGLKGRDTAHIADALSTAANATTADVADFGAALAAGGSVAKSAGLSFDQTVVALEALAASGIKNSDAGTSLKSSILALLKPSAKQAALAKDLGLNFLDQHGKMKSLGSVSAMLRKRLGGMTSAQRTATLATLAGTDGVRTLTSLYDAGPKKLAAYQKQLRKQGTADKIAAKNQDNLKGKIEGLRGSWETLKITVFTPLIPLLTKAAKRATGFVNALTKGFNKGGVSGLMNAIGPGLKEAFGGNAGTNAGKTFASIKKGASGINWGAIGDGAKTVLNTLKFFGKVAKKAFEIPGVKQLVGGLVATAIAFKVMNKATGGAIGSSARMGMETLRLTTAIVSYRAAKLSSAAADNIGTAATNRGVIATVRQKVASVATTTATKLQAAAQWLLNAAMSANPIMLVVLALAALATGFYLAYTKVSWFREGVQGTWNWIKSHWPLIVSILGGPLGIAVVQIIKHWDSIKTGISGAVSWIADRLRDLIGFFQRLPDAIWEAIKSIPGKLNDALGGVPGGILGGIGDIAGGISGAVGGATGATFTRPGWAVVGELGPELAHFGGGDAVYDHEQTANAFAGGGMGSGRLHPDDIAAIAQLLGAEIAARVQALDVRVGDKAVARSSRRSATRTRLQTATS